MADVYFKCRCGKKLAVDEQNVGQMALCPDCGSQFIIPRAVLEWHCPQCGIAMLAPSEMRAERVQCMACQADVSVPGRVTAANQHLQSARAPENLAAHLNVLFKDCPQCQERVPVKTRLCPHCGYAFHKRLSRLYLLGVLGVIILIGLVWLFWRWGCRPAHSSSLPAPLPVPAAAPQPTLATELLEAEPAVAATEEELADLPAVAAESSAAAAPGQWAAALAIARQLLAARLDQEYPRYMLNQALSLRQLDGLIMRGHYAGAGAGQINLIAAGQTNAITFEKLDSYDRLKTDESYRALWIAAQAAALSRPALLQAGQTLPAPSTQTNAIAGQDQAVVLGDRSAQYQLAQEYYRRKEYALALLYFRAAAQQNHAGAQYALGIMCYQGLGQGPNRKEAIKWLALAAAQGHAKAEQLIQQNKVSAPARQALVQQEQASQARAIQEIIAAWRAHSDTASTAIPPGIGNAVRSEPLFSQEAAGERQAAAASR